MTSYGFEIIYIVAILYILVLIYVRTRIARTFKLFLQWV